MRDYFSADVKCPFYLRCNARMTEIRCEGLTAEVISLRRFNTQEQFKEYAQKYCTQIDGYRKCSYAKTLLSNKYGGKI